LVGNFIGKYLGDRPALQLSTIEGNFAAITKLGLFNSSSALINATQILNTQAILSPKWAAIGVKRITAVGLKGKTSKADQAILRELDVAHDLGLESGNGITGINTFPRAAKASLIMFTKVEYFNRATAGLGAYHKAFSGNAVNAAGKKVRAKDHNAALEYGREVIERSQFNYSVANAPNLFRRTAGSLFFSAPLRFKKFPAFQLEFIATMKGAEHAKFWFPTLALTGYYGIPGSIQLDKMVEAIWGYSPIDEMNKALIVWAGKDPVKVAVRRQIMFGVGGNLGIDISQRAGVPDAGFPRRASDLAGSTPNSIYNGFARANEMQWAESLRAVAPGPGNFARMMETDKLITSPWDRDRPTVAITTGGKVAKGLGFRTVDESESGIGVRIIGKAEKMVQEERVKGIDLALEGLNEDDDVKWAEGLRMIQEEGGLNDIRQLRKSLRLEQKKKGMTRLERKWAELSEAAKRRHIDLVDALTPDKPPDKMLYFNK